MVVRGLPSQIKQKQDTAGQVDSQVAENSLQTHYSREGAWIFLSCLKDKYLTVEAGLSSQLQENQFLTIKPAPFLSSVLQGKETTLYICLSQDGV